MLKILIVDDTKSVHAFVKNLFGNFSEVQFLSAYNGQEALELLKNNNVDVVLLDWEMPVLDGPKAFAAFKQSGVSAPVIMMTTKNSKDDIRQMLDAGVAEYVMKPFTFDILATRIDTVTERSTFYAA